MVSVYCDNNPAGTRFRWANFCAVVCGKLFHDCDMRIQISCLIRRGRARSGLGLRRYGYFPKLLFVRTRRDVKLGRF